MKGTIAWAETVRELFLELPDRDRENILERLEVLAVFPQMYQVRARNRRFRRHRRLRVGNWHIFYKVVDNVVYIRGLWPAQVP